MAFITASSQLSQGTSTAETVTWGAPSGVTVTLTGTGLPVVAAGDYFEVRGHTTAVNNGLYVETGGAPTTSSITADKVSGSAPLTSGATAVTWLGDTADKNVFFDTAARLIYLLEQSALDVAGLGLDTFYKFTKEEWKDDDYLNAFPFPFFAIDTDAGKYIIGTDGANTNGWNWQDVTSPAIRTRKLLRSAGWEEQDANGNVLAQWAGIVTLGTFAAPTDNAYYEFGTDTTVNNTENFDFTDAVNEAILCFEEQAQTSLAITTTTITRVGGSFITEGYKVGGSVTIRAANNSANNGTFVLTGVTATVLTTTGLTADATDTAAFLAVDNRSAFSLKVREQGKTHGASTLAAAGESALGNRLFKFPLSNVTDLKIVTADIGIDSNSDGIADIAPYGDGTYPPTTGMDITYYATPQAIAGYAEGGGTFNFGIQIEANGGTAIEVYEFVQWMLRNTLTSDIDADGDIAIGRAMDDLLVFEGDTLVAGKGIPNNPDGGGSGVYITGINAVDANNIVNYDNLGTPKTFPETIAVTLDFNDAILNDTVAAYDLYFDRTVRTTTDNTFVITAGTGANGTFVSTAQFPTLFAGAGQYVRIVGLTGADAAMNGVYQVTTETSTSLWNVTRWDGATIVTTTGAIANIDQYAIDTPDAKIVEDSTSTPVQGVDPSADVSFSFSYDGNTQFGRTAETTFVVARAIGLDTAQFVQSSVQSIVSGQTLTIVVSASNELNVAA